MKQALLILAGSFILYSCTSNDASATAKSSQDSTNRAQMLNAAYDSANYTTIQWLDSTHQELGKVAEGSVVEVSWKFKNTGNKPLIISNVNPGCGCTVADKPEEPIAPGGESIIKAKFDSKGREGAQRKDVYVTANTGNTTNHILSFAVEVQKK
ncbi:MAG TPA: DUF1573 domain-containing protein [Flavisolibacter sp.]|nr:DUF1573 domain-containing protein [Flavisolibacter sp.]